MQPVLTGGCHGAIKVQLEARSHSGNEDNHGEGDEGIAAAGFDNGSLFFRDEVVRAGECGIDDAVPGAAGGGRGNAEVEGLFPGIHGDVEIGIDAVIGVVFAPGEASIQRESEGAGSGREVRLVRFHSVPVDIGQSGIDIRGRRREIARMSAEARKPRLVRSHGTSRWKRTDRAEAWIRAVERPDEKTAAAQCGMPLTQPNHLPHKTQEILVSLSEFPIDPGNVVVLAPSVVIPFLGAEKLIAGQEHGNTLADQKGGDQIADLPAAPGQNRWVLRLAFNAAVPGVVEIGTVAVILAVGPVVLLVVADQIVEGEAVVAGDEVDGMAG